MKVEDLTRYGKALDDFPKAALARQLRIFGAGLRRRYGTLGFIRIIGETVAERRRVRSQHHDAVVLLEEWGPTAINEALGMVALFNVIAGKEGRPQAYDVICSMFQEVAPYSMAALYQTEELANCDGDPFTNFKRFHLAMFDSSQHVFPNEQTDESDDLFTSTVTRCSNVEVFNGLGCPELTKLGCDHDLTGYPAISSVTNAEFRRPCTIAKGAETCDFRFYRTGTAPEHEVINGEPVKWVDALNR